MKDEEKTREVTWIKEKLSIDRLRMHELISYHIPDAVRVQVIKVSALYFFIPVIDRTRPILSFSVHFLITFLQKRIKEFAD